MSSYDIVGNWNNLDDDSKARILTYTPEEDLVKYASVPNCNQRFACEAVLKKKYNTQGAKAERLAANPFDARNEVSADGRYIAGQIVKNMWIIFVLLPIALALVYLALKA